MSSSWARSSLSSVSLVSWFPMAGKHEDPRQHVPVGRVEAGVPVVVLTAAVGADLADLALVDVVAQGDDEPDVVVDDQPVEDLGDAALPPA